MDFYLKISFVVEMIAILSTFTGSFQRKEYFFRKLIIGIAGLLCLNLGWKQEWGVFYAFWRYYILIMIFFLVLHICYEESINAKLFVLTAAYSVQTILYIVYTVCIYLFQKCLGPVTLFAEIILYILVFGVGIAGCFRIFSNRVKENKNINLDNRLMVALALCIIAASNLFNMLIIRAEIPAYAYELIYKPLSMILCILLLCLQFNLISNQALLLERSTLERLLKEKDIQYQISKENIELIQMKCHDLKYQLEMFQRNNKNVDQKALGEIQDNIDIYEGIVKTGNEVLDVILTEKSLICEKHKIKVTVMIDGQRLNYIQAMDLYNIFGNAIDNAIEAAEKQEDVEKRLINITSYHVGNLFSVRIVNYCSEQLKFENGLPVTSKEDKDYHGFGLKSIRHIAEKYGGNMDVYQENDLFVLNILLPLK